MCMWCARRRGAICAYLNHLTLTCGMFVNGHNACNARNDCECGHIYRFSICALFAMLTIPDRHFWAGASEVVVNLRAAGQNLPDFNDAAEIAGHANTMAT